MGGGNDSVVSGAKVSIRPGVSVLSVLRYLNYRPWFALAEFVDNAIQSATERRAELLAQEPGYRLQVSITIDSSLPGKIIIRDNAGGIPSAAFPRAFRPAVMPPERSGLSEFGMGMKSAASWFAARWQVRTKAIGEIFERTVNFDIAHIVRDEIEELHVAERTAAKSDHYTEIVLEDLFHVPVGRSLGKIKEHLADIYRVFIRDGSLELKFGNDVLRYDEPPVLFAPYYKTPDQGARVWKRPINFEFGDDLKVHGFAALRDPGNYSKSGFSLFRRGRLIEGSGEDGYRPQLLYGTAGSSSYARLRLFGELHLEGFEVSHTKDGFRWDENEEPFLELLKEHLDSEDCPLLRQCEHFRSLASKKDRSNAASQALDRTSEVLESALSDALESLSEKLSVETTSERLVPQTPLAARELFVSFRGERWKVHIELSDDASEADWLSISDRQKGEDGADEVDIRLAMNHPFMIAFAQTDTDMVEALLRVAAAIAIGEKLARRSGVRNAGTVRRNVNELLREALATP